MSKNEYQTDVARGCLNLIATLTKAENGGVTFVVMFRGTMWKRLFGTALLNEGLVTALCESPTEDGHSATHQAIQVTLVPINGPTSTLNAVLTCHSGQMSARVTLKSAKEDAEMLQSAVNKRMSTDTMNIVFNQKMLADDTYDMYSQA